MAGKHASQREFERRSRPWGRRGSEVGRVVEEIARLGYPVMTGRRVPGSTANIDHLVFGPAAVYVVMAKNYRGRVEVRRGRLHVEGLDCSGLVLQARRQAAQLHRLLARDPGALGLTVVPVLCFVGAELAWGKTAVDGVRVVAPRELARLLRTPGRLTPEWAARLAAPLGAGLVRV